MTARQWWRARVSVPAAQVLALWAAWNRLRAISADPTTSSRRGIAIIERVRHGELSGRPVCAWEVVPVRSSVVTNTEGARSADNV